MIERKACVTCGNNFRGRHGVCGACIHADATNPDVVRARFWSYVDRSGGPDACWPWTGRVCKNGYGKFKHRLGGKVQHVRASRFAYEIDREPLGDLLACHRCDNPPCCNPAHLFPGTAKDNALDMLAKGRSNGPLRSDAKTKVATPEIVRSVREARARGEDYWKIGADHGIGRQYASRLARGVQRKHIDGADVVTVRMRIPTDGPRSAAHAEALAARPSRP